MVHGQFPLMRIGTESYDAPLHLRVTEWEQTINYYAWTHTPH